MSTLKFNANKSLIFKIVTILLLFGIEFKIAHIIKLGLKL